MLTTGRNRLTAGEALPSLACCKANPSWNVQASPHVRDQWGGRPEDSGLTPTRRGNEARRVVKRRRVNR